MPPCRWSIIQLSVSNDVIVFFGLARNISAKERAFHLHFQVLSVAPLLNAIVVTVLGPFVVLDRPPLPDNGSVILELGVIHSKFQC
jgi:hypothetical protein